MASPLSSGKTTVDLAKSGVRVSRIRRDPPPPPAKEVTPQDVRDREAQTIVIGVVTIALSLIVILFAFANHSGWSPRQYTIEIHQGD